MQQQARHETGVFGSNHICSSTVFIGAKIVRCNLLAREPVSIPHIALRQRATAQL
jgi:hypothetical protein